MFGFNRFYCSPINWREYLQRLKRENIRARQAMNRPQLVRKTAYRSRAGEAIRLQRNTVSNAQRRQEKRRLWLQGVRAA